MAYPASRSNRDPTGIDLRENAIGILFLFLIVAACALRVSVPPNLMNTVMNYTEEGGAFYQKFHLGTYALVGLTFVVLSTRRLALTGTDIAFFRSLMRYALILGAFVVYFALAGRFNAIGFIVETYLGAVVAAILLMTQNEQSRRIVATTVLCLLIASAAMGLAESVLGFRLMPYEGDEVIQRATGLTSNPLVLGAQCALAISFVPLTRWPLWVKVAAVLMLLLGCVSANARSALAASVLEILLLILFTRWPNLPPRREWQVKLVMLFATLLLGYLLVMALLSLGFLTRFKSVVDSSSMARVQIYEIFHYVSWQNILLGMDGVELMRIVKQKLDLDFIESVPVFFVMLMGLPMALAFTGVIIGYILRLLRGAPTAAKIGVPILLIVNLTNNALATKSCDVVLLSILAIGLRDGAKVLSTRYARRSTVATPG